jgi:hypothetical protein
MGALAGNGMGIKSLSDKSARAIVISGVAEESTTMYGIPSPMLSKSGCSVVLAPM